MKTQTSRSRYPKKLQLRLSAKLMARLESAARLVSTEDAPVTPSDLARLALDCHLPLLPLAVNAPEVITPVASTPPENIT